MTKILYVCPFAHYSGHHPHVAVVEPKTLAEHGHDVTLLTFCGIINGGKAAVPHLRVVKNYRVLQLLRRQSLVRWVMMFFETLLTHCKAVYLYQRKKYDVLHVRDGEPFIFIPFIISIPFSNIRWLISLTAAIIHAPKVGFSSIWKAPLVLIYVGAIHIIRGKWWRSIYTWGMKGNRFVLAPQNRVSADGYDNYMNGLFKGKVVMIPWGIDSCGEVMDKTEARKRLCIPKDKTVLLSFGAPHSGKSMDTVFDAIRLSENIILVHAGTHAFSLGSNTTKLAKGLDGKAIVFNYFIPEDEKPLFFGCADAVILSYTRAFACESSMLWEASKYGLPVIASDANLLGADVSKYNLGLLFTPESPLSLAEAIGKFHKMTEDGLASYANGRRLFLDEHSDILWAKRCSDAYERLMK